MAAAAINIPQGVSVQTVAAQNTAASADASPTSQSHQQFSSLLDSAAATRQANATQAQTDATTASQAQTDTASADTNARLAAQVADLRTQVLSALGGLPSASDLNQTVSADAANSLLTHFDSVASDLSQAGLSADMIAQFKSQLQDISTTGVSRSVSDILTQLDYSALGTQGSTNVVDIHSLLNASTQGQSASADATTAAAQQATTLSVQTTGLATRRARATADADAADAAKASDAAQAAAASAQVNVATTANTASVVQIIPLAQNLIVAAQTNTPAPTKSTTATNAAAISPIAVTDNPSAETLDARIPPLSDGDAKSALPQVTLPSDVNAQAGTVAAPAGTNALNPAQLPIIPTGVAAASDSSATTAVSGVTAIGNAAPVKEQVAVAIRKAADDGIDHITIQLDPAGLGRVEVHMSVARDGQANLSFLVDKPETFASLSRDARGLEHSLRESGIKTDAGGMQFNLRQQPQPQSSLTGDQSGSKQQQAAANDAPQDTTAATGTTGTTAAATAVAQTRYYRVNVSDGVDIQA